ncbi:TonB-dependent receptor [Sphingosinicella sp. BN140058]|uniref:TonB-dependent receptor n=1 Tax=Sphingosinicella sp. BN140058 TaxID=1892855 RepID=UPI001013336B|nr:TonB-dependent receptor [Sphingosinicella sp. BN140058]QAY77859.1 TonB-dependent receptor [Sphingosinicella sp. BN140058]
MNVSSDNLSVQARLLKGSASSLALGLAMLFAPSAAWAQDQAAADQESTSVSADTDPTGAVNSGEAAADDDAIIVTGTRRALGTSQNIKRNADTLVDSITATDIGSFPDKSVAEALQRVPGITVNRFAATSDTAHFSAEPSGVIVRGLPQVRSEFNGRDTFSANSSRGLSWGDITPELMAGVDTYKNQTAEMIEGGIAGSINLRTRVPFDAQGQLFQFGANLNYNDLADAITPDANVFYSNRWMTGIGEFGIMANIAYSKIRTASQGIQYGRTAIIDNANAADLLGTGAPTTAYIPASINFLDNEYRRERNGYAFAAQWRDVDNKFLVTAQFNRSVYKNDWQERSFGSFGIGPDLYGLNIRTRVSPTNLKDRIPVPSGTTPAFTFDEDGFFQSGTIARQGQTMWWGNPGANPGYGVNEAGQPMFNACYEWGNSPGCTRDSFGRPLYGIDVGTGSRINQNRNMTQDAGLNIKWEASDRLRFNFDGQYVDSTVDNYDVGVEYHSFADVGLDASGKYPRITALNPPSNINQSPGGLSNPSNWYLRSINDHLEESEGHQWAFRGDAEYDFNTDWLESIKVGGRYAKRDQTVRWSTYNWANVANTWTDTGGPNPYWNANSYAPSGSFNGYPTGLIEVSPFGESFFGGNLGAFPFVPFNALKNRDADKFNRDLIGVGEYRPICERLNEMPDSCFVDNEIADVSEEVKSIYAMLRFGGENATVAGLRVSGNLGLRYVETKNESTGFLRYPEYDYNRLECDGIPPKDPVTGEVDKTKPVDPAHCLLSPADRSFINGGGEENTAKATHHHWLPSFNLRIDLSDQWLVRFAASRALSRPDIGFLKNFVSVTAGLPSESQTSDPRWIKNAAGEITGVNPSYEAEAYNPLLKPTTAWQFDVSIENYFAAVGSFSAAAFYKTFSNYIQYGTFVQTITRGDVTRDVFVRGPSNGAGAKIYGFEVAYQRFFDFLPEPLNGLGIQTNYTYVKNSGVPNSALTPVGSTGGAQTNAGNAGTALEPGSLEGLSKHSFNVVGMYEKGKLATRVAYNWRSKYLVTVVDCCVYLPVWQQSAGYLDASIRYGITENVELSLQGSNLLNTKSVLRTQVADSESPEGKNVLVPNGWFQNDRRFTAGVRVRF